MLSAIAASSSCIFLSTLSLRRATTAGSTTRSNGWNFYPRSPCGERPGRSCRRRRSHPISIHALLAESDAPQGCFTLWEVLFLSTLSLRRATPQGCRPAAPADISIHALLAESDPRSRHNSMGGNISIHALLAESDRLCTILYSCPGNFYPRSPCGERRDHVHPKDTSKLFLSTLSLRRATAGIHGEARDALNFYPRSPCGERRVNPYSGLAGFLFLSTLSLRRATRSTKHTAKPAAISIHALLAESDGSSA